MSTGLSTPSSAMRAPPTPTKLTWLPSRSFKARIRPAPRVSALASTATSMIFSGRVTIASRARAQGVRLHDAHDEEAGGVCGLDHRVAVEHQHLARHADDAGKASASGALDRGGANGRQVDALFLDRLGDLGRARPQRRSGVRLAGRPAARRCAAAWRRCLPAPRPPARGRGRQRRPGRCRARRSRERLRSPWRCRRRAPRRARTPRAVRRAARARPSPRGRLRSRSPPARTRPSGSAAVRRRPCAPPSPRRAAT